MRRFRRNSGASRQSPLQRNASGLGARFCLLLRENAWLPLLWQWYATNVCNFLGPRSFFEPPFGACDRWHCRGGASPAASVMDSIERASGHVQGGSRAAEDGAAARRRGRVQGRDSERRSPDQPGICQRRKRRARPLRPRRDSATTIATPIARRNLGRRSPCGDFSHGLPTRCYQRWALQSLALSRA